jgi:hypothetical protein
MPRIPPRPSEGPPAVGEAFSASVELSGTRCQGGGSVYSEGTCPFGQPPSGLVCGKALDITLVAPFPPSTRPDEIVRQYGINTFKAGCIVPLSAARSAGFRVGGKRVKTHRHGSAPLRVWGVHNPGPNTFGRLVEFQKVTMRPTLQFLSRFQPLPRSLS